MGHWKKDIGLRLLKMGDLRWEMGNREMGKGGNGPK